MHTYLISQQAFPEAAQLEDFVVQAFNQAHNDKGSNLEFDEVKAKLLRAHVSWVHNHWKEVAHSAIKVYDITGMPEMKQEQVIYLLEKYRYLYGDISVKSDGTYESLLNHAINYSNSKLEQCQTLQLGLYKAGMLAIAKNRSGLSDDDDFTVGDSSDSDGSVGDMEIDISDTGLRVVGGSGVTESTNEPRGDTTQARGADSALAEETNG
ncbi:hypothetical protein M422DRAFT_270234 [Sphaerobolus stellatus SS14]|uniref:DUF6532 domain-containing protein n=1 Tax=Sphaerobolus stellatus (strain SS14) TaxID=990650 RepID=A0A0C9UTH7_SPHS4|nr:hypothetical protein M422DRAFT_270234 [Sphaerobolus stellatus SS14]